MTRRSMLTVPLPRVERKVGHCARCGHERALYCVIGEWRCSGCWGGYSGPEIGATLHDQAVNFGEHQGSEQWVQWCADHWREILTALKERYG